MHHAYWNAFLLWQIMQCLSNVSMVTFHTIGLSGMFFNVTDLTISLFPWSLSKKADWNVLILFQIIQSLSIVSMVTWTPFAILCLQFLVRDPYDTSVTMAAMPALVAKTVTAGVPLVYAVCSPEIRYSIKHMFSRTCPERKRTWLENRTEHILIANY